MSDNGDPFDRPDREDLDDFREGIPAPAERSTQPPAGRGQGSDPGEYEEGDDD